MRILYIGGGSGGHLAPLVAVERAVLEIEPTSESLFVCSDTEDDQAFLQKAGVRYHTLPLPRRPLRHPFALLRSVRASKKILNDFHPDVIFSKGGIVSIPLCFVAHRKKIPIVLHESDAVMGRANRLIAKWAAKVCVGFPIHVQNKRYENEKIREIKNTRNSKLVFSKLVITGNPLRPHITDGTKSEGLKLTGLSGTRPILLVIGGSQGAQAVNEAIEKNIDALLAEVDIVHLTGRGKRTAIHRDGYWQKEFAHEELRHLYAVADMAVSRAGAGAISELAANGIPMILVPIEGLAHDHQVLNAIGAQEHGKCIILFQKNLSADLTKAITELVENPARRSEISRSVQSLGNPAAAGHIAQIILQCVA